MRDWGEYVYQSDLTEELYEITTTAYEMVDAMMQKGYTKVDLDTIRPQLDKLIELIAPDIKRQTHEN
jgi:hypothetical protein